MPSFIPHVGNLFPKALDLSRVYFCRPPKEHAITRQLKRAQVARENKIVALSAPAAPSDALDVVRPLERKQLDTRTKFALCLRRTSKHTWGDVPKLITSVGEYWREGGNYRQNQIAYIDTYIYICMRMHMYVYAYTQIIHRRYIHT